MASKFAGLFGGASPGDIRSLMEQENQARVRQAFLDQTKAGGGPLAANAARYREQGLQGLDRMLGAGAGMMGMEIPQDPRMVRASKREKDKNEILRTLDSYMTDDDVIDEQEMQQGWSLLMSRGYQDEAKEFRAMAEMMARKEIAKGKASTDKRSLSKTKLIQDRNGNKYFTRMESVGGVNKTIYAPLNANAPKVPVGTGAEIQVIDDNVGQTGDVKLKRALEKAGFKSDLNKEEAKLKQKLAVEEALLKKKNETQFETRNKYVAAGVKARRSRENVSTALALSKRVKTGGLASVEADVKEFFGVLPADTGDFNSRTGNLILSVLKDLLGARPTDADLKFLVNKMAGMVKSKKVNIRLLESALDKIDNTVAIGDWWSEEKNAKKNLSDFNVSLSKKGVGTPNSRTSPLQLPSGKNFNEWYNSLPRGSFYADPSGKAREKK
jgi:hypothetical protein